MARIDEWDQEELFETKRGQRKERKMASKRDRSKNKKTNLQQKKPSQIDLKTSHKGRVISIISQDIHVQIEEGTIFTCTLRGVLKKEHKQQKNIVVVGDIVRFNSLGSSEGVIEMIEPRYSILARLETLHQRKQQLIASNIDLIFITTSVGMPVLKPTVVDRYLIAALNGNMLPIIVVNKVDLIENGSKEDLFFQEFVTYYRKHVAPVITVSTETNEGIDNLKISMQGKTSVFAGQSGVGKSSLINATTGLDLSVGDVVDRTKKGSHTTTTAKLIPLEQGGWCIDTPGIKSFGVWDLKLEHLHRYFSDLMEYSTKCQYPNCTHIHEPNCAVKKGVELGEISEIRYNSYLALFESLQTPYKKH